MKKHFVSLILWSCTLLWTPTANAAIYINEIMAANVGQFLDPTYNYSGWIELYNDGDEPVQVRFWRLSDDGGNVNKYRIPYDPRSVVPAKGYLVIWCDVNDLYNLATNFKLDCDGGELFLSNLSELVDRVTFPPQVKGASYARTTDGGGAWQYCATPTPGRSNVGSTFSVMRCLPVTFSRAGGFFTGTVSVSTTIPMGMTLRYTTDGSEPTTQSPVSSNGQFTFNQTTTLRARLFANNRIPGPTTTHTFIRKERDFTLPIVSIVGNPEYFFSDTIGIYVAGTNGIPGNGSTSGRNWNQDWARPVNVEFFDAATGDPFYETEVDISIKGGWSRGWAMKSFDLNAEKKFEGKNRFDYPFFVSKPNIRLKHLLLRNSGNDFGQTMMKDAMIQTLVEGVLDVEYQAYQPVAHFLNGQYWGLINMRERNNKQYVYSNYGYADTEIDLFEMHPARGYVQLCGTNTEWNRLHSYSTNAASPTMYETIKRLLDVEEFINYMAVETYIGNWDWPQNNIKGFRHKQGGKFRFTLYDLDGGWENASKNSFAEFAGKQHYTFDSDPNNDGNRVSSEIQIVTIFLNLLKNATFKKQFVDTYCLLAGSVFAPERVMAVIDSLADNIRAEIQYHQQRWGGNFNGGISTLKNFGNSRPGPAISTLKSYMQLGDPIDVSLSSSHAIGRVFVNDVAVPTNKFSGKLFPPTVVRAEVPAGYTFAGWVETATVQGAVIFPYGSSWSYYDQGSLDGQNWTANSYNAGAWQTGAAPLGYRGSQAFYNGKEIATTVDKGNPMRPTTYFRRSFNLEQAPAADDVFTLSGEIDDGAVFYVNGTEIGRYLLPSGNITYNTWGTSYATGNPDVVSYAVPNSLLRQGSNVIAVEVHQYNASSSDIYIDAQLTCTSTNAVSEADLYSAEQEITLPTTGTISLRAMFKPIEQSANRLNPVRINEVSASNSIYQNEYYKLEDWVELYNTTNEPFDLAGLYISDQHDNRTRYQFPTDRPDLTVIPAYGHKIVWCDRQEDKTQLHADFKLAAESGWVFLSAGTPGSFLWVDSLGYRRHGGDISVGRYPDGSDEVYIFNRPSFNLTNEYSLYLTESPQNVPFFGVGIPGIADDAFTSTPLIAYYSDIHELHLTLPEGDYARLLPATVRVMDASGRLVHQSASTSEFDKQVALSPLATGWYIATVRFASGEQGICKFFVP